MKNRGYTLIELAIGIALLGLVLLLVWRFGFIASQRIADADAPPALAAADAALAAFAAANNRLPCADTDNDGLENCGGAAVGRLPVRELGLARADLAAVRYGVFRAASASAWTDADLAVRRDRFRPLLATGTPPAGVASLLGANNGIDFCEALQLGGEAATDASRLHVRNPAGVAIRNVAYALALPGAIDADGDGNLFDAANAAAGAFAAPARTAAANYDDTVLAVDFGQLWDRMSCAGVMAGAGHAHANAASAAAVKYAAMLDYKVQLDFAAQMAGAKIASATATVASAAAGVSSAAATAATAIAEALLSLGALSGLIVAGAAAVAANAVATVVAAATLASAIAGKVLVDQKVEEFKPKLEQAAQLATEVRSNALAADGAPLH